jgi:DNA replication and repair protein RecF
VFAELDRRRRERLAAAIGGYEQVLITAAVLEDVPEPLAGRVVHIEAGRVVDAPDLAASTEASDAREPEASGV